MSEGQPQLSLPDQAETQPQVSSFYEAIADNQRKWREETHGFTHAHEMPRVSRTIEANMKRVFAGYIDPAYPQVIIARTILQDTASERFYSYGGGRYPEGVIEEDQPAYETGIYALNEWATNYATRYYLAQTSKTPLSKSLRQFYGRVADAFIGKTAAHQTYQAMAEVKRSTIARGDNFDHAVFQGLFQHDFTLLNDLIAETEAIEAANLDELAIHLGKSRKGTAVTKQPRGLTHTVEVGIHALTDATLVRSHTDPRWKKSLQTIGQSIVAGGAFTTPGIVEVGFGGVAGTSLLTSALLTIEHALTHTDPKTVVIDMGIGIPTVTALHSAFFPFITTHEAVHAYSADRDFVGFMPDEVFRPKTPKAAE